MTNISDLIEEFLLDTLGDSGKLDINRRELADYFNVVPSQINYVLSTRFNYERGFLIESKRGGGGYISIERIPEDDGDWFREMLNRLNEDVDYRVGGYIIEELQNKGVFDTKEAELLKSIISPSALCTPFKLENHMRAQILKRVLLEKNKSKGE